MNKLLFVSSVLAAVNADCSSVTLTGGALTLPTPVTTGTTTAASTAYECPAGSVPIYNAAMVACSATDVATVSAYIPNVAAFTTIDKFCAPTSVCDGLLVAEGVTATGGSWTIATGTATYTVGTGSVACSAGFSISGGAAAVGAVTCGPSAAPTATSFPTKPTLSVTDGCVRAAACTASGAATANHIAVTPGSANPTSSGAYTCASATGSTAVFAPKYTTSPFTCGTTATSLAVPGVSDVFSELCISKDECIAAVRALGYEVASDAVFTAPGGVLTASKISGCAPGFGLALVAEGITDIKLDTAGLTATCQAKFGYPVSASAKSAAIDAAIVGTAGGNVCVGATPAAVVATTTSSSSTTTAPAVDTGADSASAPSLLMAAAVAAAVAVRM